jgi:hypothetical protein
MESYEMILAEQVYFVNNSNIRKQKLLLNSIYIILAIVGHILLKGVYSHSFNWIEFGHWVLITIICKTIKTKENNLHNKFIKHNLTNI